MPDTTRNVQRADAAWAAHGEHGGGSAPSESSFGRDSGWRGDEPLARVSDRERRRRQSRAPTPARAACALPADAAEVRASDAGAAAAAAAASAAAQFGPHSLRLQAMLARRELPREVAVAAHESYSLTRRSCASARYVLYCRCTRLRCAPEMPMSVETVVRRSSSDEPHTGMPWSNASRQSCMHAATRPATVLQGPFKRASAFEPDCAHQQTPRNALKKNCRDTLSSCGRTNAVMKLRGATTCGRVQSACMQPLLGPSRRQNACRQNACRHRTLGTSRHVYAAAAACSFA
jgi:hypothetical protein